MSYYIVSSINVAPRRRMKQRTARGEFSAKNVPLENSEDNMGFQHGGSGGFGARPREMHKAVCAECKKECEVPFKPSSDRPIYCKECFSKRKDSGR